MSVLGIVRTACLKTGAKYFSPHDAPVTGRLKLQN